MTKMCLLHQICCSFFYLMFRFSDISFSRVAMAPAFSDNPEQPGSRGQDRSGQPIDRINASRGGQLKCLRQAQEERDNLALKGLSSTLSSVSHHPPRCALSRILCASLADKRLHSFFQRVRNTVCWQWRCSSRLSSGLLILNSALTVEALLLG